MSTLRTIRRVFTVGKHRAVLSIQFAAGIPTGIEIQWDSDHPPRLSRADLARYRQLRNAILQRIAAETGERILVADFDAEWKPCVSVIEANKAVAAAHEARSELSEKLNALNAEKDRLDGETAP